MPTSEFTAKQNEMWIPAGRHQADLWLKLHVTARGAPEERARCCGGAPLFSIAPVARLVVGTIIVSREPRHEAMILVKKYGRSYALFFSTAVTLQSNAINASRERGVI